MPNVNLMQWADLAPIVTSLQNQATGRSDAVATDLSGVISQMQTTLRSGYDPTLAALSQQFGRTIQALRPYTGIFADLEKDLGRWGAIVRKINYLEEDPETAEFMDLPEGGSIDPWKINKFKVLETHLYGESTYKKHKTITRDQLRNAFTSPAALGEFINGCMTHFENLQRQWLEDVQRALVCNFIAAKYTANAAMESAQTGSGDMVVHLLSEYNTETGLSLTDVTVFQPDNFKPFTEWLYARVNTLARFMRARSEKFQQRIANKPIARHTPADRLKFYMLGKFIDQIDAMGLSNVYNDNYLQMATKRGVDFWQSINSPDTISVTPSYIDTAGEIATADPVELEKVVGVLFDDDAIGYTVTLDETDPSPYNQDGRYYNITNNKAIKTMNDITEKGVVLMLD